MGPRVVGDESKPRYSVVLSSCDAVLGDRTLIPETHRRIASSREQRQRRPVASPTQVDLGHPTHLGPMRVCWSVSPFAGIPTAVGCEGTAPDPGNRGPTLARPVVRSMHACPAKMLSPLEPFGRAACALGMIARPQCAGDRIHQTVVSGFKSQWTCDLEVAYIVGKINQQAIGQWARGGLQVDVAKILRDSDDEIGRVVSTQASRFEIRVSLAQRA